MNMAFREWDKSSIKARVVEMAETLRKLPAVGGPRSFGNNMPDVVRRYDESYGFDQVRYREQASAGAIARMEECFGWINSYLDEADRKLVYDYGFIKSRKGMFLEQYLSKNEMVRRTFERKINRCCQVIALALNRKHLVRLGIPLDGVSQNDLEQTPTKVSSENYAMHWIAPDGKPQVDPALPLDRAIDPRDIRARHSDKNRSLGVKTPA